MAKAASEGRFGFSLITSNADSVTEAIISLNSSVSSTKRSSKNSSVVAFR